MKTQRGQELTRKDMASKKKRRKETTQREGEETNVGLNSWRVKEREEEEEEKKKGRSGRRLVGSGNR